MSTGQLGSWTARTTPEAMSLDTDNVTRGTLVFFHDVQSTYLIATDHPDAEKLLGVVTDAIARRALVDVILDAAAGHIIDVHPVAETLSRTRDGTTSGERFVAAKR